MPCQPLDLTLTVPDQPAASPIPGFGSPFAPKLPSFNLPFPGGFPEDLLGLLDLLKFTLPSGVMKPGIFPNFTKDIFDGIMSLLDKFFPFLMLYKFFLPILDLIICIIEVLCAIPNPFKLVGKISRLFRECLPNFLSLFPIFALIVMLLSLLFLLLALIEYLISQILKLVNLLLKNIRAIIKALTRADQAAILAILNKIGMIICAFQQLFAVLSIFKIIVDLIKDMLALGASIPPCEDGNSVNADEGCCTPDVCPAFIKNNETILRSTGTLQYYNTVGQDANLSSLLSLLPPGFLVSNIRNESWQFYDTSAAVQEAFINITHAYDLPPGNDTIFFPTDGYYTADTPPKQVPYTVDLKLFYNPIDWGRVDSKGPRFIKVNDCVVLKAPINFLINFDNSISVVPTGVLTIAGGKAVEESGEEIFIDGKTATLGNLIHQTPTITTAAPTLTTDGSHQFNNIEYTFHINHPVLLQKSLITLGCIPIVSLDRSFVNTVFGGNAGLNFTLLKDLVNGPNFPNFDEAQNCLETAVTVLKSNISEPGVANFQAMTNICLAKLQADTVNSINTLLGIGFDQNQSTFTLTPEVQFTTDKITVKVNLNENNGLPLINNLPASLVASIAERIIPQFNFGTISNFTYDGVNSFTADLTSDRAGTGNMQMSFDNKIFNSIDIPKNLSQSPVVTAQSINYSFVYSPAGIVGGGKSTGDTDGSPRRDAGDVSNNSDNNRS